MAETVPDTLPGQLPTGKNGGTEIKK